MNYFFETIPTQNYVYLRRTGHYGAENYHLMNRWLNKHKQFNEQPVIYGIAWDNPDLVPCSSCRYDVCSPILNNIPLSTIGVDSIVPAGKYIIFTIEHTSQEINYFWCHFEQFFQQMKLEFNREKPILERYRNRLIQKTSRHKVNRDFMTRCFYFEIVLLIFEKAQ